MKIRNIVNYILLLFIFLLILIFIYQSYSPKEANIKIKQLDIKDIYHEIKNSNDNLDPLAYLVIPKLNINRPLYDIKDKRNTVEKEVMVLDTSNFSKGDIALAAHSGEGYNAYFNHLDQLDEKINIYIIYKNFIYTYNLTCSEEINKTGYVDIKTYSYPTLKLITCKKFNSKKQLVFTAKLSKKEQIEKKNT